MRIKGFAAALATGTCMVAPAVPVQAQERGFDIPASNLKAALDAYGRQAGQPIIYKPEEVRGVRSSGFHGAATPRDALQAVLANTGFVAQSGSTGAIAVVREGNASADADSGSPGVKDPDGRDGDNSDPQASNQGNDIVVTAQKREQRLQDVPLPVTAVSARILADNGQTRIQDFYSTIPGVSFTNNFFGQTIIIRGLTSAGAGGIPSPTVGTVVDDVPFGSSQINGYISAPNIDPADLSRIEVLRGPQGTLYGASSIGGLLKYVTNDPSTADLSGRLQAGLEGTKNGNRFGYSLRGTINVPLSANMALLVSGYTRRDPGYIDNILTGQRALNERTSGGGRVALLWHPADDWTIKLGALYQRDETDGSSVVRNPIGNLTQSLVRGAGRSAPELQAYTLNVNGHIGTVEVSSISAYTVGKDSRSDDLSRLLTFVTPFVPTATGVGLINNSSTKKFSQEMRASVPIGNYFELLAGAFYTHEENHHTNFFNGVNASTGDIIKNVWDNQDPKTFEEYAVFADLTWKITDRFDIQVGGRWSHNTQTHSQLITGPLVFTFTGKIESIDPKATSSDSSFTYLFTPRFKINNDLMIYARLASGYRPGGPNNACNLLLTIGAPCSFGPDRVTNYEIGAKGSTPDHVFSFDVSAYYIDWKDIQIGLTGLGGQAQFTANAAGAKSQGLEISAEIRPAEGLRISGWGSLNSAELTADFPQTASSAGLDGDWLPSGSRVSANLSVDQEIELASDLVGFAGATASYIGKRTVDFRTSISTPQRRYPAYTRIDLRAGVRRGGWSINGYVTNLTDRRGQLAFDPTSGGSLIIKPRTIGATITTAF